MKFPCCCSITQWSRSPPSRGAWIEIAMLCHSGMENAKSPPSRGAWIEMDVSSSYPSDASCRPPRGGRGLKYHAGRLSRIGYAVAPLAGGVD